MKTNMNILFSINRRYKAPLKALLHSLYINNEQCGITIHLLHTELTGEDISELSDVAQKYSSSLISYQVSDKHKEISNHSKIFPPEIFYRLLAGKYLPENIKRVLYLDSDIIINGSLESLYNINLTNKNKNYIFAAATDPNNFTVDSVFRKEKLGLSLDTEYVNSGVLLMNLEYMRESGTIDEIIKQIPHYGKSMILPDQDLINVLYHQDILHIDPYTYNYFPASSRSRLHEFRDGYPVVIHYSGIKPWQGVYPTHNEFTQKAKTLYDYYSSL